MIKNYKEIKQRIKRENKTGKRKIQKEINISSYFNLAKEVRIKEIKSIKANKEKGSK